jgi:hypothetical protein
MTNPFIVDGEEGFTIRICIIGRKGVVLFQSVWKEEEQPLTLRMVTYAVTQGAGTKRLIRLK